VGVARDGGLLERAAGDDGLRALRVQLEFRAERLEAAGLAQEARAAERSGAIGRSLALWDELANRLPYDEELVQEARAQSARFLDAGLARARELEREFERARFFGLADLHRALRSQALELEQSYAPSEVAEAVRATRASIEAELHELEAERRARRDARLAGVLAVLEAEGDLRLAQHVAAELSSAPSAEGAGSGEAAGGGER
jgi:hypothetical protein